MNQTVLWDAAKPSHLGIELLSYALMTLFVIAVLWAIVGKIDIVATAPDRIIVSDRTKVIQPLEASVYSATNR